MKNCIRIRIEAWMIDGCGMDEVGSWKRRNGFENTHDRRTGMKMESNWDGVSDSCGSAFTRARCGLQPTCCQDLPYTFREG